ncbi:MAG: hypothetical protein RL336_1141 [Pseudomonadota bacterium]|jgi:outer membrane receptor protein involved in Fe transport
MKLFTRKATLSLAVAAAMGAMSTASAQQLEEVVVTATKRAESLQDVPISMLAVDGDSIREAAITKMEDLTNSLPGVSVLPNPVGNFIFIRGIGSSTNQGIEQSVSIFHDGIYMGRHQLSRAPFMDLERVEVLRGPQSILFGKNTIGGAISVISAKPTEEFEGFVSVLSGDFGEQEYNVVLSGPLTDTLRGRIAARGYQTDGYVFNELGRNADGSLGRNETQRDDETVRLSLEWDVSDNTTLTFKHEDTSFNDVGRTQQMAIINPLTATATGLTQVAQGSIMAAGGNPAEVVDDVRAVTNDGGVLLQRVVPALATDRDGSLLAGYPDLDELSNNNMAVTTVTLDTSLGDNTLTAIYGRATYDYQDICDCDFAAIPLVQVDAAEDYTQDSLEIRLASPGGETLDWLVGAYFHDSDLMFTSAESFGAAIATPTPMIGATGGQLLPNITRDYFLDQQQTQTSIFGSGTWNVDSENRVTFGLRYTQEDKDAHHALDKRFTAGWDATRINVNPLTGAAAGELTFGDTAAEYDRVASYYVPAILAGVTAVPAIPMEAFLNGGLWEGLLNTYEHDITGSRSESFLDWSINFEHDVSEDTMVFFTASTGVKGGGFDARYLAAPNAKFEYEEEKAKNFELGMKSTLLDGGMTLNATLFRTEVDDLQVSIFDGKTAFLVDNAGAMRAQGLEFDMKWAATENLTVTAAGNYLDSQYTKFDNSPCWVSQTVAGTCDAAVGQSAVGKPNVFSPKQSFNLRLDHVMPLGSMEVRSTLDAFRSGDHFTAADLDPVYAYQAAYTRVNARIALTDPEAGWELAVIGKNLTDVKVSTNNNDQPLVPGNGFSSLQPPKTVAIQASYKF